MNTDSGTKRGDDLIVVGRLGAPYGVKGWSHLQSFTEPPGNLFDYAPWWWRASDRAAWQLTGDFEVRTHGDGYIVRFADSHDREQAVTRRNWYIGVAAEVLPQLEADEAYWHQLVGARVVDKAGVTLGTVVAMLETGAHDVLVVNTTEAGAAGKDRELLIPYTEPYLVTADVEQGRVIVDWDPAW